ncbi:cuticle protein CP14.6-like [Sitophilus oryzae]|uniref:Cuticle protein CP14.6-like n=1 Tax=Sitophilus oryzae TaxID=7048 RepID=A0A6J2X740_SITOR|nr:cuticle protein CP14.6-like [Sitophilus oryzae]
MIVYIYFKVTEDNLPVVLSTSPMKAVLCFTLLVLIGLSNARPQFLQKAANQLRELDRQASVLRSFADIEFPSGYRYAYDTSNNIHAAEIGELKNPDTEKEAQVVEGQYSYVGDDGKEYKVHYTADEDGFHPTGEHLHGAGTKKKLGIPSAALASLAGGGLG